MLYTTFGGQFYRHNIKFSLCYNYLYTRNGSALPCFMPTTYIFHLKRNPEIKVRIPLITIDDCKKMIGKTYYLIHKDYEPSGKPFQVVVDSIYPEDDCEIMSICVCHRLDKNSDKKIEVGFECLFKSRFIAMTAVPSARKPCQA